MKKNFLITILILIVFSMVLLVGCSSKEPAVKKSVLDGYPDRPINVLVGYGAGGGSDTHARTVIKALNDNGIVDQSFTVENLPGASGVHAFSKMQNEPDDIYQIFCVPEMGIPLVNGALDASYDDFQRIAQVGSGTHAMFVKADSPFETVEQVLDAIEKDPQSVSIPVPGALDSVEPYRWYTIFEEIGSDTIELGSLNIIPTDGNADVITNIIGGHMDVALVSASANLADQVEAGNARVLAVLSPERLDAFPDAPTLLERGINIVHNKARGFWIGKDVPEEIVQYWEDALKELMETPEYKEYLDKNMIQSIYKNSEEYTQYSKEEGERFGNFMKRVQESR